MGRRSQEPQARTDHGQPPGEAMNLIRIVVTGVIAGAAAWATLPAAPQRKKAPPRDMEPVAVAKPDQADLDRSQIIGNRELPKVTYIVPWKKPGAGDLSGRALLSVLRDALI